MPKEQETRLEIIHRCHICEECKFEISIELMKISCLHCGEIIDIDTTRFNE